jgi:pimeloyl-ACP methyl ester carboxylesterase
VISTASSVPPHLQDQSEVAVHDRRVTVEGMDTQYLEAGTGSPLLLLHGHEQSATSWRWVIPALARTHRVLALSLPGHGETAPAVGDYAPGSELARFAATFLDTLDIGPPLDLVGHSAGGMIALRLALAEPQRIRTLTLVDSAGLGREVHPLLALDTLPIIGELAITISRLPGGDLGRTTMSTAMLFAQPWRVPADFVTEQHALGRRPGQLEASTAMARALFGPNGQRQILLDQLPALPTPTLVI